MFQFGGWSGISGAGVCYYKSQLPNRDAFPFCNLVSKGVHTVKIKPFNMLTTEVICQVSETTDFQFQQQQKCYSIFKIILIFCLVVVLFFHPPFILILNWRVLLMRCLETNIQNILDSMISICWFSRRWHAIVFGLVKTDMNYLHP